MFKFKITGKEKSVINRLRAKFNKKPLFYRAKVFLRVEFLAFYYRYLRK